MINKLQKKQANDIFKNDDWYKPMLFFNQYRVKNLTIDFVKSYLEGKKLRYEIQDEHTFNDDNYSFIISSTNQYDLYRIFKRDGTHFYTDHVYNRVNSVAYMDNPPVFQDEIIINIEHNNGWLVDDDEWKYFLQHRFDIEEDTQEVRDDKLAVLLEDDVSEKMAEDFSFHLIRHIRKFNKKYSNSFVYSVYDFYKRKGYITKRQLEALKKIMYTDKGYMY